MIEVLVQVLEPDVLVEAAELARLDAAPIFDVEAIVHDAGAARDEGDEGAVLAIDALRLLLFCVLSAAAVLASLHAWRTRQAYGLFRFLAFECLALLIAWNVRRWFREPFSTLQVASWILLAASAALAAHGIHLLRVTGKAQARVMEGTRTVVQVGVYRYIRHPLYAALVLLGWAVFCKGGDLPSAALAAAATAFLTATARSEERFNIDRFGATYSEYMKHTKMFVPFVL